MRFHIFIGANGALLFAAKEHKADGAAWKEPSGLDGAGGFDNQRHVAAVVERARAQFPRIEMRTKDDRLVGFLVPANFAYNVFLLDRPANLVWHVQHHENFARG